jgi:hypothetical protein
MMLTGHPKQEEERLTMTITTIGLDLAKSVFQTHGVDENGAGEAAAPQTDAAFLLEPASVPDRRGGVRNGALLGSNARYHGS